MHLVRLSLTMGSVPASAQSLLSLPAISEAISILTAAFSILEKMLLHLAVSQFQAIVWEKVSLELKIFERFVRFRSRCP